MKSLPKLILRFAEILFLSTFLLIILNVVVLMTFASDQVLNSRVTPNSSPWSTAQNAADCLKKTNSGYTLDSEVEKQLKASNAWAIFIENNSGKVVWNTDNLPSGIPLEYTLSDIADLTRGYINDCPTFTGDRKDGLLVVGYPETSFWKHMYPSWDYDFIRNLPKTAITVLAINIGLIFLIYLIASSKLIRSVKPISNGITDLPTGVPVHVKETGLLSELAKNINKTSQILQSQQYKLRKRETARANWIAGVSHDIRTPLSMVMGYAGQLKDAQGLSDDEKKKVSVILKQSEKIRNLISDLNLSSKLEYNMQPLSTANENAVAIVRQVVVDFINTNIDDKYSIVWKTEKGLSACFINADKSLISRAVSNLIQNSINHNENGCNIYVEVKEENSNCIITVADDGIGATSEQLKELSTAPHYTVCDTNTNEQRHGLGLLIVKQIAASHSGSIELGTSSYGGFEAKIILPKDISTEQK